MKWTGLVLGFVLVGVLGAERKIDGPLVMLIGPPGSGKSTQGVNVAKELGVPLVSVEDLIEENQDVIKRLRQSGLTGIEAETDPVLNKLFAERLARGDLAQGAVLDGYPSTKEHADFLAAMVQSDELPSPIVIQLEIPDEEVRRRMAGTNRSAESVEQRLKDYHRELGMLHV